MAFRIYSAYPTNRHKIKTSVFLSCVRSRQHSVLFRRVQHCVFNISVLEHTNDNALPYLHFVDSLQRSYQRVMYASQSFSAVRVLSSYGTITLVNFPNIASTGSLINVS
ncbi:hypothetical protein K1T71_010181 [Dendrolimus kikuchii]|uniref:Uncharacterized protein n=1 Tax=Dendrolimus kikuchii TaxID=765133 RepID=A0ACC1CRJ8_9NEOP|nr:hypothetical protein K1T71_010181 [Dendrolimus kikuchii]